MAECPSTVKNMLRQVADERVRQIDRVVRVGAADVDVLEITPRSAAKAFSQVAMLGGPLFKKYGVYLDQVTVAQPPYEYESRLQEMVPRTFRNLHLMALDPYGFGCQVCCRWHSAHD